MSEQKKLDNPLYVIFSYICFMKRQSDGKTSSLVSVPAEGVGQDGHGPVAGADVGGDVDGEPVGFERGASVDQGCGESGCE